MQNLGTILRKLARESFSRGLISAKIYRKRLQIAEWIESDTPDPRAKKGEVLPEKNSDPDKESGSFAAELLDKKNGMTLHLVVLNKWVFTIGDPDPKPSIPHGHLGSQNRKWPKLDPYRGQVFTSNKTEEKSERLTKAELRILWNDNKFRRFCLNHIIDFKTRNSNYKFRVNEPTKLPRKR